MYGLGKMEFVTQKDVRKENQATAYGDILFFFFFCSFLLATTVITSCSFSLFLGILLLSVTRSPLFQKMSYLSL